MGKLGRVQNNHIKFPLVIFISPHNFKHIRRGVHIFPIAKTIAAHITLGHLQHPLGRVDIDDAPGSGISRIDGKGAGVGKRVQNFFIGEIFGHSLAVFALIQVKTGFVAHFDINQEGMPILHNLDQVGWKFAPDGSGNRHQPLLLTHLVITALINADGG